MVVQRVRNDLDFHVGMMACPEANEKCAARQTRPNCRFNRDPGPTPQVLPGSLRGRE